MKDPGVCPSHSSFSAHITGQLPCRSEGHGPAAAAGAAAAAAARDGWCRRVRKLLGCGLLGTPALGFELFRCNTKAAFVFRWFP